MIYLITANQQLFESNIYKIISIEESLAIMKDWKMIQFDTETLGKDPHVGKLLLVQFGNIEGTIQIVVDCTTVSIKLYKNILEENFLIGQNLKKKKKKKYKKKI